MKTRTLIAYWCLMPLALALYIIGMASASAREKGDGDRGPKYYASPGHHYGVGHGRGKPDKTP